MVLACILSAELAQYGGSRRTCADLPLPTGVSHTQADLDLATRRGGSTLLVLGQVFGEEGSDEASYETKQRGTELVGDMNSETVRCGAKELQRYSRFSCYNISPKKSLDYGGLDVAPWPELAFRITVVFSCRRIKLKLSHH